MNDWTYRFIDATILKRFERKRSYEQIFDNFSIVRAIIDEEIITRRYRLLVISSKVVYTLANVHTVNMVLAEKVSQ